MNFHPQEASPSRVQGLGAAALQIDDLNNLIDSLKRREENIIQLLDYNLKFRGSSHHMDVIHLRGLYNQLEEKEKKRIEQENIVIHKYLDLYISDDYQKKLIFKMKNKIIQLNSSARDKLIQLGIYKQARQAYIGLSNFEETLGQIVNKTPLDAHLFLNRLVDNSRKRFADEIEQDPTPATEFVKQKSLDATHSPSKALPLPKAPMAKSVTPSILTKEEEKRHYEVDNNVNSPNDNTAPPEPAKIERASFIVKSIEPKPSFDIREDLKASYDMLSVQKPSYVRYSSETTRYQESNSPNETLNDQTSPNKPMPSYRESNPKAEVMGFNLNLNGSNMGCERSQVIGSNISSRTPYVKKVKITSNKRSVCLEEANVVPPDQKDEKKEPKPNKEAWLKNYDILKIEYTPLPTATKKETKKLLMEKVYKELLATNTEIKKTIKRYSSTCASIISREHEKEELAKKRSENIDSESNRGNVYTPKAYSSVAPLKVKAQTMNPTQRNIFFVDSTREAEQTEIGVENFLNAMNPFYPNSTSNSSTNKQNKDLLAKKSGSTKFLILPKLNLFPENQVQNAFPVVWPVSSQGSKPIKSNLIVEVGNRPRFEKPQKVGDRPMNHLLADTKQTLIEQEKTGVYIVNQHLGGSKVFPNSSKQSYPMTLFPFEPGANMNKQIPL